MSIMIKDLFVPQQTLHISVLHEVCATTLVEAAE